MGTRDRDRLWREAAKLCALSARRNPSRRPLPPLFFVTDPVRTPDPVVIARTLPRGCGVIYRGFGGTDAYENAAALAVVAKARGLVLLIGADAALAARVGAHGVHLPERAMVLARALRAKHPRWILTAAAHSPRAVAHAARLGLDAALVSPVFPSRSPSAGRPLGPVRFARLARGARLPVYALGGVDARTIRRLARTDAAGAAAVDGFFG